MNVKFAPIGQPLNRKLETLSMASVITIFLFVGIFGWAILIYMTVATRFWWFGLAYGVWMIFDDNTPSSGEPCNYIKNTRDWRLWYFHRRYFPITLVKTHDLSADKSYIFASHPHGVWSLGYFSNFITNASPFRDLFPGLNTFVLLLGLNFYLPFIRELYLSGGFRNPSEKSMVNILDGKKGNVAVLLVGGVAEAFKSFPGPIHIVANKRKGFVRVALKTGASIVPVFSFGENNLYRRHEVTPNSICHKLLKLIKWKGDNVLPNGRGLFQYTFGVLPHRRPIVTVVGKPIDIPKMSNPTQEEIDKYHKMYVTELVNLFEEHKQKYSTYPEEMNLILD